MPDSPVKGISSLSLIAGERIRRVREAAGWSQQRLADAMGERQSVVSAIERGLREVYLRHIEAAAVAFDVPEAWFVARPAVVVDAVEALRERGLGGGTRLVELGLVLIHEAGRKSR